MSSGGYRGVFVKLEFGMPGHTYLTWIDEEGDEQIDPIRPKIHKALAKAKPGDLIDLEIEFERYTITKARIHSRSLEERVELLEAALAAAGIEIPQPERISV